jgi:putative flippase GtrA
MRRLLLFAATGIAGFLVDAGTLALLLWVTPLGPLTARLIAIALAMLFTFWVNRTFTFGRSARGLVAEGARYGGVGLSASMLNYALYFALVIAFPTIPPVLAVAVASLCAMGWSFLGYSRFVFGPAPPSK